MLFHLFWVLLSFFAVIGILECLLELLDWFSFRRVQVVEKVTLTVTLKGEIKQVDYLLNTLCLKCEKADVGLAETGLVLVDGGLTPQTREQVQAYCEKNPWVVFTESTECDKII